MREFLILNPKIKKKVSDILCGMKNVWTRSNIYRHFYPAVIWVKCKISVLIVCLWWSHSPPSALAGL